MKAIVACDNNFGIGYNKDLLYKVSDDMKRFVELTSDSSNGTPTLIFGRVSFEPIGKYLKNRNTIILSHDEKITSYNSYTTFPDFNSKVCITTFEKSNQMITEMGGNEDNVWICGGSQIYNLYKDKITQIEMTVFLTDTENVDTYFFDPLKNGFKVSNESDIMHDDVNDIDFKYVTYVR